MMRLDKRALQRAPNWLVVLDQQHIRHNPPLDFQSACSAVTGHPERTATCLRDRPDALSACTKPDVNTVNLAV
ncbi:MAG: hypothetical protein ABI345_02290 [Jatrophihabitans sp.]